MNIRLYKTGDAQKICQLLDDNSPYTRDIPFWVWLNRLLSIEQSIIAVAEIEGLVVGHYAIVPKACLVNGEPLKSGIGLHAFVHPDYRKHVSITLIASVAYEEANNQGIDFIYGFPNANYRLIQEKIERWSRVALFNAYEKKPPHKRDNNLRFDWKEVEPFNFSGYAKIEELIDKYNQSKACFFEKSLPFFVNRYILHPQNLYKTSVVSKDNETIAIVVTKFFSSEAETKAHIIDYMVKDDSYLQYILEDFEKFYHESDMFVHWHTNQEFSKVLINNGYQPTGFDTFFGIKFFSEKAKALKSELLKFDNWSLVMGDSDAF